MNIISKVFKPNFKYQTYNANFKVEVKNLLSSKDNIHIILPFPLETSYQILTNPVRISPHGKIVEAEKLGNKYVYWKKPLEPNQEISFILNFKILIKPRLGFLDGKTPTDAIFKNDAFVDASKILQTANSIVKNESDPIKKVEILNDYVMKKLQYGNPIKGLYNLLQTLKNDKVDCGGFDVLLTSLCLSQKIPARIVSGFFANKDKENMHAWLEIFIKGKGWMAADPSIEKLSTEHRTKKRAKLGALGSDRIALSIGHNFQIKIGNKKLNIDILQNPIVYSESKQDVLDAKSSFEASKI